MRARPVLVRAHFFGKYCDEMSYELDGVVLSSRLLVVGAMMRAVRAHFLEEGTGR